MGKSSAIPREIPNPTPKYAAPTGYTFRRFNSAKNREILDATLMAPVRDDYPFQPKQTPVGIMMMRIRTEQARESGAA